MPPVVDINNKSRISELCCYYCKQMNEINDNKLIEDLRNYFKNILKIEVTEYEFWTFIRNCSSMGNGSFRPLILLLNEKNIFIEKYEDNTILQYMDIFAKNIFNTHSLMKLSDNMIIIKHRFQTNHHNHQSF